jgi:hypothetical protein
MAAIGPQGEPRVAITIADPANPYRALQIRGIVVRIDEDTDYHFIIQLDIEW